MATSDAPLQIGRVVLTVNDLDRTTDFYESVIGLHRLSGDAGTASLGVGGRPLVELRRDPAARYRPHDAGLFHTAFLLPDRAALADWLRMIAARGIGLDGASDHLVSEAVYLRDPEGNGIEVYADRPRDRWHWQDGEVRMDTVALDLPDLLAQGSDGWQAAPEGTVVGHVHLQVGDLTPAEAFYRDTLGLDRSAHRGGASFFSSGGYHHHLAGNIWHSRGAGPRRPGQAGLSEVVLEADPGIAATLGGTAFSDPWGTRLSIEPKA